MPDLTLSAQDRQFLAAIKVTDAPLLMTEKDWVKLCGQLRDDIAASDATFQQLAKAYKRLEKESADAHCEAKQAKRSLKLWRGTAIVFIGDCLVLAGYVALHCAGVIR